MSPFTPIGAQPRRYKLTLFRLIPPPGGDQTYQEEVLAYSAEDAVYQFRLKQEFSLNLGQCTPPSVHKVEPA